MLYEKRVVNEKMALTAGLEPAFSAPITIKGLEDLLGYVNNKLLMLFAILWILRANRVKVAYFLPLLHIGLEPIRVSPADFTYHYSFHYQISLFVVWTMPLPLLERASLHYNTNLSGCCLSTTSLLRH